MSGGCWALGLAGVVIELTSIGKHIGWVTLGPDSDHGDIKQTLTTDRPGLTRATVEILLHDFINLRGEGDVVVRELAPGNEQESQRVVVKSVVTMNMGRHLQSVLSFASNI